MSPALHVLRSAMGTYVVVHEAGADLISACMM